MGEDNIPGLAFFSSLTTLKSLLLVRTYMHIKFLHKSKHASFLNTTMNGRLCVVLLKGIEKFLRVGANTGIVNIHVRTLYVLKTVAEILQAAPEVWKAFGCRGGQVNTSKEEDRRRVGHASRSTRPQLYNKVAIN